MNRKVMQFISVVVTLSVFIPAAISAYLWQAIMVGWCYGEWLYDPELFETRYKKSATFKGI